MKKSDIIGLSRELAEIKLKANGKRYKFSSINGKSVVNTMELFLGTWLTIENDLVTRVEGGVWENE